MSYVVVVDCCLVAALQGAALTAGGFLQPTYIAEPGAAAAAAAGTSIRYPSSLLPTVIATSNGLQYAMYVLLPSRNYFPSFLSLSWRFQFNSIQFSSRLEAHGHKDTQ